MLEGERIEGEHLGTRVLIKTSVVGAIEPRRPVGSALAAGCTACQGAS